MKRYLLIYIFWGLILGINPLFSQLSSEHEQEIDKLFSAWDTPNHPGGSVGIMQEGQIIYSKGFGLASLEYKVPNTYGTLFNIASVSKQFTSMGILLLEKEGKLNIDDDIRKYLPELQDFGHTVTIRHCMLHTSGLRSLHAMLGMAGWRGDDSRSNEDLWRFMKKQKELNFKPGDEYLYCNTGYMFLSRIIERISKEKFPKWMKENIFLPMGMKHTYVEDDYSRVVDNNATSYYGRRVGNFSRAVEFWGYVGSGNIHATTDDLLLWLDNYHNPKKGWEGLFNKMQSVGTLNNGKSTNYAFGISMNEYKGDKMIGHGGSIGGFRANIMTFPYKKLNLVVLTNYSAGNPQGKIFSIVDILNGNQEQSAPNDLVKINAIALSSKKMKKFEGHYWNPTGNFSRKIYIKNDTLRYSRGEENETNLLPISQNKFQMAGLPFVARVHFEKTQEGKMNMIFEQENEQARDVFEGYEKPTITKELISEFTGKYYSEELDTYYTLYMEGDELKGSHTRHGDFPIEILRENYLEADLWVFGNIQVQRDKNNKVTGLRVSNGRVRNLWFEKL